MTYINPRSVMAAAIALPLLSVICVGLRLSQKFYGENKTPLRLSSIKDSLDDLFCILALIPTVATGILVAVGASQDIIGSHSSPNDVEGWIETVTPPFAELEKLVYIIFILQPLALGFVKLSFLFFYRRIFAADRKFNIISWTLIVVVVGWMIAFFFGFTFDCQLDFAANWSSLANIEKVCGFGFMPTITYTILDAVLDFIILVLPIPWIFQLQMTLQRKVQVSFIILLGGLAVAAAIVRMSIYIETSTPNDGLTNAYIMGLPTYDVVGIISAELFWTMVETGVAVIAACLPSMHSLVMTVWKAMGWSSRSPSRAGRVSLIRTNQSPSPGPVKRVCNRNFSRPGLAFGSISEQLSRDPIIEKSGGYINASVDDMLQSKAEDMV